MVDLALPMRWKAFAFAFAFAVAVCALPATAWAAPKTAASDVTYEKKTVINFEDDTIQGDLTRPDGEYVEARKKVQHSNLIRVREEFRAKVLQSAGEL